MASRLLRRTVVALATLGVVATSACGTAPAAPAPTVRISQGELAGVTKAGVDEFLGVPYAAPPVGALRWRPPEPAARWSGVRQATAYAPHCAQPATTAGQPSMSEDCLYLNVFAPTRHTGRLPVMVFVHGGALYLGESDDYDPSALVRDGVVVVTINYRLGALGFLAHPALASRPGGPSGNYGLMDQQAALRWVQGDIGAFGGDARDVTLFGQSAGGLSVLAQLASPGARGLFDRAIVESGGYDPQQQSLSDAESAGEQFATDSGCADQTAACLRKLSVSQILDDQANGYTPDVDGEVLTEPLTTAFAKGDFARVPVIDGTNHDEYRQFVAQNELAGQKVTAAGYPFSIAGMLGAVVGIDPSAAITDANTVAARYPLSAYPSPPLALSALGTDAVYACTALRVNESISKFVPTYAYEFNDENAPPPTNLKPVSFPYAAEHTAELQYLFNLPGRLSKAQLGLAATMRRYWTGFAKQGGISSTPSWPRFDGTGMVQSLVPGATGPEANFATAHQCAFWNTLTG